MKKILILVIFINLSISSACFGVTRHTDFGAEKVHTYSTSSQVLKNELSCIEKNIYGMDYSNLSVQERLKQAELLVYGQVSSTKTSDNVRIARLIKDLNLKIAVPTSNYKYVAVKKTAKSKPVANKQFQTNQKITQIDEQSSDDDSDPQVNTPEEKYPIVDKMEMQIFKKTYTSENIYSRLKRLEMSAYKTSYENESLSNRVDRLRGSLLKVQDNDDSRAKDDDLASQLPSGGKLTPDQTQKAITNLEKYGLKTTYPNDKNPDRLARLETHFLNQTFPDDDAQTRIERIGAVAVAEPGAKEYDNLPTINKMQDTATYVRLGSILLMILGMFF